MEIRPSTYEDAWAAAELLRRSIAELCVEDHRGDPGVLARWLENKTPETFARWLDRADNLMLSAEEDGRLLGVGGLRRPDEVVLNYVHPDGRFRGVSRALMAALEDAAREAGAREVRLTSTRTAHRFYRTLGYADRGETSQFGLTLIHMGKEVAP